MAEEKKKLDKEIKKKTATKKVAEVNVEPKKGKNTSTEKNTEVKKEVPVTTKKDENVKTTSIKNEIKNKDENVQPKGAKTISYQYNDSIFTDLNNINYFKQARYFEVLENSLLGEYDNQGRYVISPAVMKELIMLKKTIENSTPATKGVGQNKLIYLKARCGDYYFRFVVELEQRIEKKENTNEQATDKLIDKLKNSEKKDFDLKEIETSYATLKLIEEKSYIKGEKSVEIVTPIVNYKDDSDVYFMTKIKKLFNIADDDNDSEGRNKANEELAQIILSKLDKNKSVFERLMIQTRINDKIYIDKILSVLTADQKFGAFVIRRFNALLREYGHLLDPNDPRYYHNQKLLLDKILFDERGNVPKEIESVISSLRKTNNTNFEQINEIVGKVQTATKGKSKEGEIKLPGANPPKFGPFSLPKDRAEKQNQSSGSVIDFGQTNTGESVAGATGVTTGRTPARPAPPPAPPRQAQNQPSPRAERSAVVPIIPQVAGAHGLGGQQQGQETHNLETEDEFFNISIDEFKPKIESKKNIKKEKNKNPNEEEFDFS